MKTRWFTLRAVLGASGPLSSFLGAFIGFVAFAVGLTSFSWSQAQEGIPAADRSIPLPADYRDWRVVSVAHEDGDIHDLRTILGNDVAIEAYRKGATTFPDGARVIRIAWAYTSSTQNNKAFGREQSFVPGEPTNIQLMVKDSANFRATGGWGFAQFSPSGESTPIKTNACFTCHSNARHQNFVFTHHAP